MELFNLHRDLAGLEYLVIKRFILTQRRDVDVISVVTSDLTNQLPNVKVLATEFISNAKCGS